jgi:hypothetical protein
MAAPFPGPRVTKREQWKEVTFRTVLALVIAGVMGTVIVAAA